MEIIQNLELKCIDDMIWCEKEMYDLFISVGDACRVAHHLQKCSLRGEAYPLDWHMEYSLDTVIDLFETDFEDFFAEIEEIGEGQGANRKIVDVKNQIVSIHYFQMERPLEEAQNEFCEKMKKRFFRLNERLKNAGRVMLCRKGTESTETLIDFLKRFSVFYQRTPD